MSFHSPVAEEDVILWIHRDGLSVEQYGLVELSLVDGIVGLLHFLRESRSVL